MELLDYARLKRRLIAAGLALGIVVIAVVALRPGGDAVASAQVVVRPPNAQAGVYATDIDRYIEAQLVTFTDRDFLAAAGEPLGLSAGELAAALSVSKLPSSDTVTVSVTLPSGDEAVAAANGVAEAFVTTSRRSGTAQARAGRSQLAERRDEVEQQLARVGATIRTATQQFIASSPAGIPSASVAAPRAAARQAYLQSQLDQIAAADASLANQLAAGNPTRVLKSATDASGVAGLDATALAISLAGLLALAALAVSGGLALSPLVVSPPRWQRRADGSPLLPPVRLETRTEAQRARSRRRVGAALAAAGEHADSEVVVVVAYPEPTDAVAKRTDDLLTGLRADPGLQVAVGSTEQLLQGDAAGRRCLLLVDTARCELADLDLLLARPDAELRRTVPVLVCP